LGIQVWICQDRHRKPLLGMTKGTIDPWASKSSFWYDERHN
jgi:hypothetical protein